MRVCPASRGEGTRVFEDRRDLKLAEATGFGNGLALLRYEITNWGGKGPHVAETWHVEDHRTDFTRIGVVLTVAPSS